MIALLLAAQVAVGPYTIDTLASVPLAPVAADHGFGECHVRLAADGQPLPDPACTPGAVNPTLTVEVLRHKDFRTGLLRDKVTSAAEKRKVYAWYGIAPPAHNTGANQTCELDHVIDLGAGGGDGLANIWPQCQLPTDPPVPVGDRHFEDKDRHAEHVMMAAIKAGATDAQLADLQKRIAADWTQLDAPGAAEDPPH